jgi:hypothetical protein
MKAATKAVAKLYERAKATRPPPQAAAPN